MLSIIIVNYRTRELLRNCLESLRRFVPDAEVIVVDNASDDGSLEMLEQSFPTIRAIGLRENVGFARGNNAAIPFATGEFILLLNSDTVIENDSLTRCVQYMRTHTDVGALSPRLLGADDRWQTPAHAYPSLANQLRQVFRRPIAEVAQSGITTGWLTGTALFLRRTALNDVGGLLDSDCFMYWEDCDLSARLHRSGWQLVVLDDAYVRHYGGASGGGADDTRRPDLDAWYLYGETRWFANHRPATESIGRWILQSFDVVRMTIRSYLRPERRNDRVRAMSKARSLVRDLFGMRPPLPGSRR